MNMHVKLVYHGRCFDGVVSCALFTAFYRQCVDPSATFQYYARMHSHRNPYAHDVFDAPINAVVDFRYSSHPNLHWWFDHHSTTFLSEGEREHFESREWEQRFFDPSAPSCAQMLVDITQERYGFDPTPYQELVHWANLIDTARFPDAKSATFLTTPALQIMSWIEQNNKFQEVPWLIQQLVAKRPLAEILREPKIQQRIQQLLHRHRNVVEWMNSKASKHDKVVTFDLTEKDGSHYNKFAPYYLFPDRHYCVIMSRTRHRIKLSIGENPWNPNAHTHSIGTICQRYGGGGHDYVGGIALQPEEQFRAHQIVQEIVDELNSTPSI